MPMLLNTPNKEAHSALKEGHAKLAIEDFDGAKLLFNKALNLEESAEGYCGIGLCYRGMKKSDKAMEHFEAAINIDPSYSPAYAEGAKIFAEKGQGLQALDCYACAIANDPENIFYKDKFIYTLQDLDLESINPQIMDIVMECLETPEVDTLFMGRVWKNILDVEPTFAFIKILSEQKNYEDFCARFESAKGKQALQTPLFLNGLKRLRAPSIQFEKFLSHLRHLLLDNFTAKRGDFDEKELFNLAYNLAQYCFNTDYIFPVNPEENKALETLHKNFTPSTTSAQNIAILACYGLLSALEGFETLSQNPAKKDVPNVLKTHVTEILERRKLAETIPNLTDIRNEISLKVQDQYETLPYPRWETFAKTPYHDIESALHGKNAKILNAGCGTGHEATELAAVYTDAQVLAVDLSRSSLAYAQQKAELLGLENITYKHADILELGKLDEEFDFIACSGVLHHMEDPFKGWKVLTDRLKPGGTMRIALYSKAARKPIIEARDLIREHGYDQSPESVRAFRYECEKLLDPDSYRKITASREFYNLSECVDLLFHAQEHQMTLPQIKEWLEELGLEFLSFQYVGDMFVKYRMTFPLDTQATNLDNWHKFEQKNPDAFIGMYRFWCRKNN